MDIRFYNSLSGKIEEFKPIKEKEVSIYVCGPTVYNDPHIGNMRPVVFFDTFRKFLEEVGYSVKYVSNYTDVDDKIIKKAIEEKKTEKEITTFYIAEYEKCLEDLNVAKAYENPKVTDYMNSIISYINGLVEKGAAYVNDGEVFFNVAQDEKYGELSKINIEDLISGARIEQNSKKQNPLDFLLWKNTDEGIKWESPWCLGRPGWHTECCVMIDTIFKGMIDIHGGGIDLKFPHHENEIAQSECANGCKFVNYWLHNGFVTINKEKMSKSLGNFLTIDDLLKKYDANTIRFFILTNHYRMPVEFSDEALQAAANGVKRILNAKKTPVDETIDYSQFDEYKEFVEAMDDDLNTSKALAVLFDLTNKANKDVPYAYSLLNKLAAVLGFTFEKAALSGNELNEKLSLVSSELGENFSSMEEIIEKRKTARAEKNWDIADKIRIALDNAGIILKDSKEGTTWEVK